MQYLRNANNVPPTSVLLKVRNYSYYSYNYSYTVIISDWIFFSPLGVSAISPVFSGFFFFVFWLLFFLLWLNVFIFLFFIGETLATTLLTVKCQLRILSAKRKGNIRLWRLIRVHLNRRTSWHMWFILNLPCSVILACREKHPIKSKLCVFLPPLSCHIVYW